MCNSSNLVCSDAYIVSTQIRTLMVIYWYFIWVKGKFNPTPCNEGREGVLKYNSNLSSTSAIEGGGWLTPCSSHFTSGNNPVPIV